MLYTVTKFETCIPKIPIARPRFQTPNYIPITNFYNSMWSVLSMILKARVLALISVMPKLLCCMPAAGIARYSQLSSSWQAARQHGLPSMVKITPTGPLSFS